MEYLSKDTVLRIINHQRVVPLFYREFLQEHIKLEKAADVAEVKHGKWIDSDPLEWDCSVCGYRVKRWNSTPHCPHCGTKMDGDKK